MTLEKEIREIKALKAKIYYAKVIKVKIRITFLFSYISVRQLTPTYKTNFMKKSSF